MNCIPEFTNRRTEKHISGQGKQFSIKNGLFHVIFPTGSSKLLCLICYKTLVIIKSSKVKRH